MTLFPIHPFRNWFVCNKQVMQARNTTNYRTKSTSPVFGLWSSFPSLVAVGILEFCSSPEANHWYMSKCLNMHLSPLIPLVFSSPQRQHFENIFKIKSEENPQKMKTEPRTLWFCFCFHLYYRIFSRVHMNRDTSTMNPLIPMDQLLQLPTFAHIFHV